MRFYLSIISLFFLNAILASPTGESSLVDKLPSNHVPNWDLMLTPDGKVHLIDTNEITQDPEATPRFDARTDVEFHLYTRNNRNNRQNLVLNNANSIRNSFFSASRPTRYIIHGWNNHGGSAVNTLLRDAYLNKADVNVIVVDWGAGANHLIYSVSRDRIDSVAEVTAEFIDWLARDFGNSVSNTLVTGHSLGGHTAGLVGKKVRSGKIPRIVAMDPAGPLFSVNNPGARVDRGDATFVEVIHTNTGLLGLTDPIGHVDIYPNGGSTQPGCGSDISGACAHGRAYEFYAESITSGRGFTCQRCSDRAAAASGSCSGLGTIQLGGEPLNTKTNGIFYVSTNANSPYAQ